VPPAETNLGERRAVLGTIAIGTVVAVALTIHHYGATADGLVWSMAQVLLGFVAAWDVVTRRILNVVVLPAAVVVVLLRAVFAPSGLTESLVAGVVAFAVFLVLSIVVQGGLGMGDVKLAGLIGLLLGNAAFGALLTGCVAGGIAAAVLVATGRKGRKSTFAYGPYLALGGAVWIIVGHPPPLV
jgi:leader peptidase (prepilin peptidase)/N-methyltransferase